MTEVAFDLEWEALGETGSAAGAGLVTERAQVFGGWLVRTRAGGVLSLAFVPDEQFRWDGEDFGDEYEEEDEDAEEDEEGEEEDEESDEEDEEDDQ